jgi:DEAD/DEAH box helicase domain-containing protein
LLDTGTLLERLGYDYLLHVSEAVKPDVVPIKFSEILPELADSPLPRCRAIAGTKLYSHQKEAYDVLAAGLNLVLKSGTGSGKTEAWFLYAARHRRRTLAIYPTLALSNDQLERLKEYCAALGLKVFPIDALRKNEYVSKHGARGLSEAVAEADIVVTNPAYLLNELKRIGSGKPSFLKTFLSRCGLIVLDEFDFYGPRSIAILLSMVGLIHRLVNPNIQVTLMTATLQNPEDVGRTLTAINGRASKVVDGRPFQPENRTYLVLGKSLEKIWAMLRQQREKFLSANVGPDVLKALDDFEEFKRCFFKVVETATAAGVELPEFAADYTEILEHYARDDVLTLAFTPGIATAEEYSRRLSSRLEGGGAVATHHHLLLKTQRAEVEEAARNGVVKTIFTPRTLSQGIDIGLVRRVVHLGLPREVREFRQREGRKGRRPDVAWTETVVIPLGQWDRDLLSRGVDVFLKWVNLPMERTIVNDQNLYGKLFQTLFAYLSPSLRKSLKREDVLFLRSLGLERDGALTAKGKSAWLKMNFYEFAPPFGIKRWRVEEGGGMRSLEDISHVDLVEKFQPGAIDPSSDGVVVEHRLGGGRGRVVTAVVVDGLYESRLRKHDALSAVLEEYEQIKHRWGETPNIRRDYFTGRLQSLIHLVAQVPLNGFGYFTEFPNRVEWRVVSNRKQVVTLQGRTYISRERRTIQVPTPTYGVYGDYTYGLSVEASPLDDPALLRLGACFIALVLRRVHNLSLELLKFDVMVLGERKVVVFYENESTGFLPSVDWGSLRRDVEGYLPDELDEVLLEQVDEQAYSSFFSLKLDWEIVKKYALKIIDYILIRETLRLQVGETVFTIPKPSRALKTATLAAVSITLRDDLGAGLYSMVLFDGENVKAFTGVKEMGYLAEGQGDATAELVKLLNQGFRLAVYDLTAVSKVFEDVGLEGLKALLNGLVQGGKVLEVRSLLERRFNMTVPLHILEQSLGLERSVWLPDLVARVEMERRRRPGMAFIRSMPENLLRTVVKYLEEECRNTFAALLLAENVGVQRVENIG